MDESVHYLVHLIKKFMEITPVKQSEDQFSSENTWLVHCLSLATIGMLAYMQLAPIIA